MAQSITLKPVATTFPVGTTVGAYKASNWPGAQLPPTGAPVGSADETAVVQSDGSLSYAALTPGIEYYAVADVGGGTYRALHFNTSDVVVVSKFDSGAIAARPAASSANRGWLYLATDVSGGTLYESDGSAWTQIASGVAQAPIAHATTHVPGGSDAIDFAGKIHMSGLAGSRPAAAASNSGALYFATDTNGGTLYRSNGSAWTQIAIGLTESTTAGGDLTGSYPNPTIKSSVALAGVPTAATAAVDTSTTQIATTAFVLAQAAAAAPVMDGVAAVGTSTRYARADHVHASDTTRAALAGLNTFTRGQTIAGTADEKQLIVKGNSTQTANLQEWQNSTGAILGYFAAEGFVANGKSFNGYASGGVGCSVYLEATAVGNKVFRSFVTGGSQDSFYVSGDGTLNWGGGTAATDVSLARQSAGAMRATMNFVQLGSSSAKMDIGVAATIGMTAAANSTAIEALNGELVLGGGNGDSMVRIGATTLGFYGTAPVARSAAYTQTYATATRTHSNPTAVAVATTAAALASYGYTQAQADAIPVAINALVADVANVKQVVNSVIDDLQANGLLQ